MSEPSNKTKPTGTEKKYESGNIIVQQGELTAAFYSIKSGQVDVFVGSEPRVCVATLGPGDFFGEMACLTGDPVSATVEASSDLTLLKMGKDELLDLISKDESFRQRIISALVKRVQKSNVRIEHESLRAQVMTQVMCRESESRYGELVGKSEVMTALRAEIESLSDDPAPVAIIGELGTGKKHIAARIHYNSRRKDEPLLFLNGLDLKWDKWKVQLKAASGGTVVLDWADHLSPDLVRKIISGYPGVKIVLCAEATTDLEGINTLTVPPLRDHREDIPILARHFLQRSSVANTMQTLSPEVMRRLVGYPYLAGNVSELFAVLEKALVLAEGMSVQPEHLRLGKFKKSGNRPRVGLALGGGAVRGVAHVGVLKVLEQTGVNIDYIAGTSVGSLVGGLYASGLSIAEMERILPVIRWSSFIRPVWPQLALTENSRMGIWLQKHLGCKDFSELKIPFACVASDMLTGEAVILRSGCLATAIRASTAIPLMMKPVHHKGRVLIDGGINHAVPAALCRSMGADLVIAINVSKPADNKILPRNLVDALLGVIETMSNRQIEDELEWADIVLRPQAPISGYSFDNAPVFFALGEKMAIENIDLIRRRIGELAEEMASV